MPSPPTLVDVQKIVVAAQPTPGQGLALDFNGKLPTLKKLLGCDYGQVTLTYPGGSIFATAATVTHLIGTAPTIIVVSNGDNSGLAAIPAGKADTITSNSFRLICNTVDGTLPIAGSTSLFNWFALV